MCGYVTGKQTKLLAVNWSLLSTDERLVLMTVAVTNCYAVGYQRLPTCKLL